MKYERHILWCMVLGEISPSLRRARDVAVREGKQWALLALYLEYFNPKYLKSKGVIWGGK